MNQKHFTLLVAISILCISSLFAQKKENRKIDSFESLSLSTAAHVYIKQADHTSLRIEGDEDRLKNIITVVEGNTLKIKRKKSKRWNWNESAKDVRIYISSPKFEDIRISGSGNIIAKTPIKSNNVEYRISGSGNIVIDDLHVDKIECHISGSGDIHLEGEHANELEIRIAGSGDVEANRLKTKKVEVRIAGSGDCNVYASESIDARIAGSGDIYYRGNPKNVSSNSAGSGKIKSID